MDFSFNDEQQMLSDTMRRFIAERYDFDYRRGIIASDEGWSRDTWKQLGELGLLSLAVPEDDGGIGAGPIEVMLVGNAIGEGLLLEPFLASAVVATQIIAKLASSAQRAEWLPLMASGELVAVLAHDEHASVPGVTDIQTRAVSEGDGWRLDGAKSLVYHAPAADLLLVSAQTGEGQTGVFAVAKEAPGLSLSPMVSVDGQRVARVTLDNVRVGAEARLGGEAGDLLQAALDLELAALCAEAFGAMERIFAATIEYSRSRVQFGVPIGSFQALQHRMAEMLMHLEQARSMSYLAASSCAHPDPRERRASLSAAKTLMGQAARYIGQQAVQLHGGMGMTDELNVSHYFKRLLAFELRCGTTDQHLEACRMQLQAD